MISYFQKDWQRLSRNLGVVLLWVSVIVLTWMVLPPFRAGISNIFYWGTHLHLWIRESDLAMAGTVIGGTLGLPLIISVHSVPNAPRWTKIMAWALIYLTVVSILCLFAPGQFATSL